MVEHFFQCPYCWEEISFLIDVSVESDVYIEDCEVCCNPIEAAIKSVNGELVSFQFKNMN